MIVHPVVQRATRQGLASSIYLWILGVLFLFAAFSSFSEHKVTIGLGYLVFTQSRAMVLMVVGNLNDLQNLLADSAERKTRHTILHAAELGGDGMSLNYPAFWGEVDHRVEEERQIHEPASLWKSGLLVLGGVIGRGAWDILGIGLVAALTA